MSRVVRDDEMTPAILYHVTDAVAIPNIEREGLRPEFSNYEKRCVWAFDDINTAKRAAENWRWSYLGGPAILTIDGMGIPWEEDGCTCGNTPGDDSKHAWRVSCPVPPERIIGVEG